MWIVQWLMMSYGGKKEFPKTWLVSYYKLDNNANDSHWSNNGTVSGATYTASGKINGAYSFNGGSNYISTSWNYGYSWASDNFSTSCWINILSLPTSWKAGYIFTVTDSGTNSDFATLLLNSWGTQQVIYGRGKFNVAYGTTITYTMPTSTWLHIVVTQDGNTNKLYINNSLIDTGTVTGNGTGASNFTKIWNNTNNTTWFNGIIDEIGYRKKTLTTDEISDLYNWWSWLPYS